MAFRARRRGQCGQKWHMDVTYLQVENRLRYLYRAIDKEGNLVDMYLSETRDAKAAETFFKSCGHTTGVTPSQIFRVNQHPLSERRGIIVSKFQEYQNIMMATA